MDVEFNVMFCFVCYWVKGWRCVLCRKVGCIICVFDDFDGCIMNIFVCSFWGYCGNVCIFGVVNYFIYGCDWFGNFVVYNSFCVIVLVVCCLIVGKNIDDDWFVCL